jgi:GT2 family glycosyltransferase
LSLIIVNWNTRELLASCLRSLDAERNPGWCEIIVVDNASADGSADMIASCFPQITLVRNDSNVGFARAVNQGVRIAKGAYLLLLNSDTEASFDTIERCLHYLEDQPDVAAVGCRMVFANGKVQSSCFRFPSLLGVFLNSSCLSHLMPHSGLLNWDRYGHRNWEGPTNVDCVMGSFMLLRQTAIEGNVLFDETFFMYGEETDLCMRWRKKGFRVVHLPDVTIKHLQGGSAKTPAVAAWAREACARGELRCILKRQGSLAAYCANILMLLGTLPRVVFWVAADVLDRTGKTPKWRRALRTRVVRFHMSALFFPSVLNESWTGPEAP